MLGKVGLFEMIQKKKEKKKSKDHVPGSGFGLRIGSCRVRRRGPSQLKP